MLRTVLWGPRGETPRGYPADYTRLRVDLTAERTRYWQRLEKLLEDALIKITAVASRIDTLSVRDMVEALIAGQRNPRILAGLARGRLKLKHADLVEALTGQFDDHHAVAVDQPERREQVPRRLKRPALRHHQPRQLPRRIPVVDHEHAT